MERNIGIRRLLSIGLLFELFQAVIGGSKLKRQFVQASVDGGVVLDVGCGTGVVATLLPGCRYTGIDLNPDYIRKAKHRGLPGADFILGDCVDVLSRLPALHYDHLIMIGVMHHLEPESCPGLLSQCARVLKAGGRLHGMEPAWANGLNRLERFVMRQDRGNNILAEDEWRRLLASHFVTVSATVRRDALRIPYAMLTYECRDPRPGR